MTGSLTATSFVKSGVTTPQNYLLQADGGHILKSSFSGSGHTHPYLPLTGGTLSGTLNSTTVNTVPAIYKTTNTGTAVLRIGAQTHDKGFGLGNHGELIFGDWSAVSSLSSSWDKL